MYEPKWQNIIYAQNRRILERSAKFKAIIEQRVFIGIKNILYFYKRIFCQPLLLLLDPVIVAKSVCRSSIILK